MFTDAVREPVAEPISTALSVSPAAPPYVAPAVFVSGPVEVLRALLDELDPETVDHGIILRVNGSRVACWAVSEEGTVAELLGGLRRAADLAGADLRIDAALVVAERAA